MWWCDLNLEYKVQIFATLGGIIIALISTFLAHYFSRLSSKAKSKKLYQQSLESIDATFDWQLGQLSRLETSLNHLKDASVISKKIVIDNLPVKLETNLLLSLLDNLVSHEKGEKNLLKLIIVYINHIDEFNYQLDFKNANKTLENLNDKSIEESINEYFKDIKKEYIDKIQLEVKYCKQWIEKELKK